MKQKIGLQAVVNQFKEACSRFSLEKWLQENLGIQYTMPVQAGICFVAGFLLGFIFKRYFKFLFVSVLFAGLLMVGFESLGVITIDWQAVKELIGWVSPADAQSMASQLFEWVKNNSVAFIASLLGFLIGCKVG